MGLVNRNVVRTILNAAEVTSQTNDWNANPVAFEIDENDNLYIGWRHRFTTRHFNFVTPNTNTVTVSVEFWDGSDWQGVDDLIDQTNGFKSSGFVSWAMASDKQWQKSTIAPLDTEEEFKLFWIRVKVSGALSAGTSLQSILNLFTDDDFVRIYYPELITDTRYRPSGRTDLMDIHVGARNLVVTRMKQLGKIQDESEIIDINQVAIAGAHAFAVTLLKPIAVSEDNRQILEDAKEDLASEISRTFLQVDSDLDGRISEPEKANTDGFITRRGDDFSRFRRTRKV